MLMLVFLTALFLIGAKPAFSVEGAQEVVAEGTWTEKAPLQEVKCNLGVAAVNGRIYAIGGENTTGGGVKVPETGFTYDGSVLDTNEEYDPETDTWTYKQPMPTPRSRFATAVLDNKIYCIGGLSESGVNEVYDPATDTWETKAPMPTARLQVTASVVNGKIYLIGGRYNSSQDFLYSTLNEVYDPETDSWTTKAPMLTAIVLFAGVTSVTINNKIYVIGAIYPAPYDYDLYDPETNSYTDYLPDSVTQIYDPETDSWTYGVKAPLKHIDYGVTCATLDVNAPEELFHVMGKYTPSELAPSLRVFDDENDLWLNYVPLPSDYVDYDSRTGVCGYGVANVNDILYVIGGYILTNEGIPASPFASLYVPFWRSLSTVWAYTPSGFGSVPPKISVVSPESINYTSNEVSLDFTVNKDVEWTKYCLDGGENVTVNGNVTLAGLSVGLHEVTVYACDEFGNVGASETITFEVQEPFPTSQITLVSTAASAIACIGFFFYFRKKKTPH